MPRLKNELYRIGLLNSKVFEWRFTVPSNLDNLIHGSYSNKKWMESIGAVNGAIEQSRIMKESLLLGYSRILIIEDDVAFLRDLDKLKSSLENLPDGYDFIQCDKAFGKKQVSEWSAVLTHSINDYYVDSTGHHFGLSDANVYSLNGMEKASRILDLKPIAVDQIDIVEKVKKATAKQSLCIQVFYGHSNYNAFPEIHDVYTRQNLDYEDYAIPEGYRKGILYSPTDTTWNFRK